MPARVLACSLPTSFTAWRDMLYALEPIERVEEGQTAAQQQQQQQQQQRLFSGDDNNAEDGGEDAMDVDGRWGNDEHGGRGTSCRAADCTGALGDKTIQLAAFGWMEVPDPKTLEPIGGNGGNGSKDDNKQPRSEPSILNPRRQTLDPKPKTQIPKSQT